MREKLLIIAYRAYGDWLYTVPVLPFLFERYDVYLECNNKVFEIMSDDPRFCGITMFDANGAVKHARENKDFNLNEYIDKRIKSVTEEVKPDRIIDLSDTLERKCMALRDQEVFFASAKERRSTVGSVSFYDAVFEHVGMPKEERVLDALWYSKEQTESIEQWRKKHTADFLVLVPLTGSCIQKFYPEMVNIIRWIVDKYHNAHVCLLGNEDSLEGSFNHPRVRDLTGKIPIKQAILMTRYADYVIGPETGLLVAAGMWGTPKTMLCTSTSVKQACSYQDNDYSLQSCTECSPCHKGIYITEDCEIIINSSIGEYSGCVHGFDNEEICSIVDAVYDKKNIYNSEYFNRYVERAETEIGKALYKKRWDIIERHCSGHLSLLDYGCASGAFHKASRNGFETCGYDINPNSPFHKKTSARFDIMTMWDVIEHLHDPKDVIEEHKPGYLFISTPNLHGGVEFDTWKHNRPEEHLQYFNEEKLERFLDDAGYKIVEINYEEGMIRDPQKPKDILTVAAVRK